MSNNINIKLKTTIDETMQKLKNVSSNYSNLTRNTNNASKSYAKFYKESKKLNTSFSNITKDADRASQSIGRLGNNLLRGISAYGIGNSIASAIQNNIDMTETINLYNVAMGEFAESTNKSIESLSKFTGLDVTNLQNRVGTYNLLARSMGISSEQSAKLSENTNRLALDLASLTNISINQVAQDLRSGLVGQSETMYKYGVDVTEASLKVEALNQGITKSVRNMSQGEKMALRYSVMMRQTALSHGDFAQTIDYPANQLKILSERFATLTRTIGSVFIPMLTAVLPYINAIVTALTRIIARIGVLVGYKPSEVVKNTSNGFGGIADNADDASKSIDKTGKAVKKLRSTLAGFDEINILSDPKSDSGGGKKKDEGSGSPFDLDLVEYDSMFDKVKQKSDELVDAIMPKLETLLKIIGLIAIGFLSWKISNAIIGFLTNPTVGAGLLATIGGIATKLKNITGLGLAGFIFTVATRILDLYTNSELFRKGLVAIWEFGKKLFEGIKTVVTEVLKAFVNIGKGIYDLLPESVKSSISNFFTAIGDFAKKLDLDIADLLITFAGFALLGTPFGVPLLLFEALTIAIRGIGYGASDALDEIDFLAEGISEATIAKLEPFREKMNDLNNTISSIHWGNMVMDESVVSDIRGKLREVTQMIVDELDADKNESLANLAPLKNALGEDAYNELLSASEKYYTDAKTQVENNEKEILKIIENAQKDGGKLTQDNYDEIQKIREKMNNIGLKHISETEVEYNTIMNTLKDNAERISLEQATSIIANAKETREKTISEAQTQYSTIELEANRMLEVGAISTEQYKEIMESAKKTKETTIKDAETQYKGIYDATYKGLGDTARYMDKETDTMKTKWGMWTEGLKVDISEKFNKILTNIRQWNIDTQKDVDDFKKNFTKKWEDIWKSLGELWSKTKKLFEDNVVTPINNSFDTMHKNTMDWVNNKIKPWFTKEKWINIMDGVGKAFSQVFKDAINGTIKLFNKFIDWVNDKLSFSWEGLEIAGKEIIPSGRVDLFSVPRIPQLADGGIVDAGQMFVAREAGAELVGSFGNKTGVMNNQQIVDAVAIGVSEAVSKVMGKGGNTGTPIVVNVGGKTLVNEVVGGINRQSMIEGKTIINV